MKIIGIMSGTSLDGVDVALVDICGFSKDTKVKVVDFLSVDMPIDIKEKIKNACDVEKSNVLDICSLNFELGQLFGESALKLIEKANLKSSDIDLIASHGQTIYHIPFDTETHKKSTLQIGDPSVISKITGCKVVSNFREADMAVGGTGAPLVPYVDYIMYSEKGKNKALNNIGGISNVTVLKASDREQDIIAFDTGPGNMIIDEVCLKLFGKTYDKNGELASKGKTDEKMLRDLMSQEYFDKKPPKATGREDFGGKFVSDLLLKYENLDRYDILKTVTEFTAKSIIHAYKNYIDVELDEIIFCGGGAYNTTLINLIKKDLKNVKILDELGISSFEKEAVQFAVLGNEFINNSKANLPSVTGASKKTLLGRITYE